MNPPKLNNCISVLSLGENGALVDNAIVLGHQPAHEVSDITEVILFGSGSSSSASLWSCSRMAFLSCVLSFHSSGGLSGAVDDDAPS
jgi:hypothetical protein